jgi:hypothetical protein
MNSIVVKFMLAIMVAGSLAACASAPPPPPAHQADGHIVQGGSFAGEGMMYFPLPFADDKK